MKQATKQQQDAKTNAAATEATKTSAKQAQGKRKASPDEAKPATGNGHFIYQKIPALRCKNIFFIHFQTAPAASSNSQRTYYIPKKIRPAEQKHQFPFESLAAAPAAPSTRQRTFYIQKNVRPAAQKNSFPIEPRHRTRRTNHPPTHILYTKTISPCGATTLVPLPSACHRPPPKHRKIKQGQFRTHPRLISKTHTRN